MAEYALRSTDIGPVVDTFPDPPPISGLELEDVAIAISQLR